MHAPVRGTLPGIGITAATVAALAAGYVRSPRRGRFPAHGWLGIAALAAAELLLWRGVEPVPTYFTPIAWSAFLLIADGAVLALTRRSRLRNAPGSLARMALLSIPLWLIFEAYNLRLQNWVYTGLPRNWPAALLGYAWSFATITPAIFEGADLAQALWPARAARPWRISRPAENLLAACGAACLIVPLLAPRRTAAYLFGLVWIGFALLLDPVNHRIGLPSLLGDLAEGFSGRLRGLLLSGWLCGWLWEFWNYWAGAKWHYIFPMFQNAKIFEMPLPGYLGFPAFALECFTMYVTVAGLLGWLRRAA